MTVMTFDQMKSDLGNKRKEDFSHKGKDRNETIMEIGQQDSNTNTDMNMSSDLFDKVRDASDT